MPAEPFPVQATINCMEVWIPPDRRRSAWHWLPTVAEPRIGKVSKAADRWSRRASLLFLFATCGSFWAAVGFLILH